MTSNGKRMSGWKWARWLAVAISAGGVIYLLAWYVPAVLVRHKVDTSVESAWISAVATLLGVGATAAVAIFAFWYSRLTNQATIDAAHANLKDQREQLDKTFAEQREQLNTTLAAQRDQLDSTLAEQRTRTLNERFAAAAGQLGSDKPAAVRLAGVYAMAGLADDWEGNRQTCVDVLCGYLRMPHEPDPGGGAAAEKQLDFRAGREVRHTVIRVITAHLKDDAAVSWRGLNFDFTGTAFDGGDFAHAEFSGGAVSFDGAEFCGTVSFTGARFSGGTVSFDGAEFCGTVSFTAARFSGATVNFGRARFSGGTVSFTGARFSGGTIYFGSAGFSGGTVYFNHAQFSDGMVSFGEAGFSGGTVSFRRAGFSGGMVLFADARFSGGTVSFTDARFSGGTVSFTGARFSGGTVSFTDARFSGGEVDFTSADDWSVPPAFPWTGVPPQGVKLSKKEDQAQA